MYFMRNIRGLSKQEFFNIFSATTHLNSRYKLRGAHNFMQRTASVSKRESNNQLTSKLDFSHKKPLAHTTSSISMSKM